MLSCIREGLSLEELTLEELKRFSPVFEEDVFDAISLKACVEGRKLPGGPAPEAVSAAIEEALAWLSGERAALEQRK